MAVGSNLNMAAQLANAEISAFNPASGYLYTVGGGSGSIVVSDLRNPSVPVQGSGWLMTNFVAAEPLTTA